MLLFVLALVQIILRSIDCFYYVGQLYSLPDFSNFHFYLLTWHFPFLVNQLKNSLYDFELRFLYFYQIMLETYLRVFLHYVNIFI